MLKEKPLANSAAAVVGVGYVLCRILTAIAPQVIFTIGQSWFHTVNLSSVQATTPMSFRLFLLGLVSSMVVAWVSVYAAARLYNRWEK